MDIKKHRHALIGGLAGGIGGGFASHFGLGVLEAVLIGVASYIVIEANNIYTRKIARSE